MLRKTLIGVLSAVLLAATVSQAADKVKIQPDVVYGHKYGMALTFDHFAPLEEENGAGVLFMVSGGWYSRWSPPEKTRRRFQAMLESGFTVFAVRHGSSPKFSIPEAVSDVRRAVRFVRQNAAEFGVDPNRLGVFGMSAGGHLSLMLGTTADVDPPDADDPLAGVSSRVQAVVAPEHVAGSGAEAAHASSRTNKTNTRWRDQQVNLARATSRPLSAADFPVGKAFPADPYPVARTRGGGFMPRLGPRE